VPGSWRVLTPDLPGRWPHQVEAGGIHEQVVYFLPGIGIEPMNPGVINQIEISVGGKVQGVRASAGCGVAIEVPVEAPAPLGEEDDASVGRAL